MRKRRLAAEAATSGSRRNPARRPQHVEVMIVAPDRQVGIALGLLYGLKIIRCGGSVQTRAARCPPAPPGSSFGEVLIVVDAYVWLALLVFLFNRCDPERLPGRTVFATAPLPSAVG